VVYSLFSYHQKNLGDPGSSRGVFERIRVGLTTYIGLLPLTPLQRMLFQQQCRLCTDKGV
jgi:hypothetical protein